MMQSIEYVKQAELALAAYGDFVSDIPTQQELRSAGFSDAQANSFIPKYNIVAQSSYSVTGLSATVFEEINSGKKYSAIRGTEPSGSDLTSDGLLAAGLPSNFNPQFMALKALLEEHWLVDGTLDDPFTVTGHSLGAI